MSSPYASILRLYPESYRVTYGDDLLATVHEMSGDRFSIREAFGLAANGLRQRVIASTSASPGATWRRALRLAAWFSLLNWMTFRLVNAWQAVRSDTLFAGRDRTRIGDVDVVFPYFHPEVSWLSNGGMVVFAIAAGLVAGLLAMLLMRVGPAAVALAVLAGLAPSLMIETTAADVLLFVSHIAVVGWFVARGEPGERGRILALVPVLMFATATACFSLWIQPRSAMFEHVWGTAEMVGLGFALSWFTLAGLLLIALDPRMLPLSASVYGLILVQVLLPAIGDGELVGRTRSGLLWVRPSYCWRLVLQRPRGAIDECCEPEPGVSRSELRSGSLGRGRRWRLRSD